MQTAYRKGREGEDLASSFLREKGYRILQRNYRTRSGEIDLIASLDSNCLVFVEVKNWSVFPLSELAYNLNWRREQRFRQAAEAYLLEHPEYDEYEKRFDLVVFEGKNRLPNHIEGVLT